MDHESRIYIFHEAHRDPLGQPIRDRRTFAVMVDPVFPTESVGGPLQFRVSLRIGIARCSPLDQFSRRTGRRIATDRAISDIRQEHHGPAWPDASKYMLRFELTSPKNLADGKTLFSEIVTYLIWKHNFRPRFTLYAGSTRRENEK
jgi:hypothetical protein